MTSDEFTEQLDENLRKWFKEKWVRFGPDGKIRGACARGDDSEGKPKCLPQKKAHALGKKGRKYAASKKRREDPNPERRGKAKNVATKKKSNEEIQVNEKWSQKYKDSINCSNPKGFSQKAHCAGKKKNEDMTTEAKKCPHCGGPLYPESMINEKKDACYHKVRSRYKVWPSAYASGALVQCRKKGASNWGTGGKKKNESNIMKGLVDEGVIIGHDAKDPDVAVLGGAGSYKLSNLKKKAQMEANDLAKDVSEGKFKNSAYNVKQLANTLNTIVAAEDEMEKNYFGEGYALSEGQDRLYNTKDLLDRVEHYYRTPGAQTSAAIRLYNALRNYYRDEKGEMVSRKNLARTPNLGKKALEIIDILYGTEILDPKAPHYHVNLASKLADDFKDAINKIDYDAAASILQQLNQAMASINKKTTTEDYTGEFAAEKTPAINPYGGQKDRQFRGAISETPTDNPTGASGEGGWRKYKPKSAGTFREDLSRSDVDNIERFADKLYKKLGIDVTFTKHFMDRVNDERNGKPISGAELVRLFKKEYERWGKDVAQMGPDMEGTFKDLTTDINLPFVLRWDRDEEELDLVAKTVMRKKNFKTHNKEFPVESRQELDEKCWDTHKQVGMKKKGDKMVPNCVPKESAIMRGLKRESK